jgi:GrpB-like predicted nucleotidyltransferase (UPF0157 family)
MSGTLAARLRAAGVDPERPFADSAGPWDVWLRLWDRWHRRATLIDLYELEALRRGVAAAALPAADRSALRRAVAAVEEPGLVLRPGTEPATDPIEISSYDPEWPRAFERWRARIAAGVGSAALHIEHVGSTSVPGLAAKPVVDIEVGVADLEAEDAYVPALESTGLEFRLREPWRRFFRPPNGQLRDVHVHVCVPESAWSREHLLFRNYLRASPAARDAYAALKFELARRWHNDRPAYNAAKTAFILDTLDDAGRWAAAGAPQPAAPAAGAPQATPAANPPQPTAAGDPALAGGRATTPSGARPWQRGHA